MKSHPSRVAGDFRLCFVCRVELEVASSISKERVRNWFGKVRGELSFSRFQPVKKVLPTLVIATGCQGELTFVIRGTIADALVNYGNDTFEDFAKPHFNAQRFGFVGRASKPDHIFPVNHRDGSPNNFCGKLTTGGCYRNFPAHRFLVMGQASINGDAKVIRRQCWFLQKFKRLRAEWLPVDLQRHMMGARIKPICRGVGF